MRMRIRAWVFSLHKAGNLPEEYEDAWCYDEAMKRLAIADGASDAFEARLWARGLVESFVREPPAPDDAESIIRWLEGPAQAWREEIPWDRLWSHYVREKAQRGAFSTFLGLTLGPSNSSSGQPADSLARWEAWAVGDTCLFHVRDDTLVASFPLVRTSDFGRSPPLLSTRLDYNRHSLTSLERGEGVCQQGDVLLLATDTLAHWFLGCVEAGENPWQRFRGITADAFGDLVQRLRHEGSMRNDDVTLMAVQVVADMQRLPSGKE